MKQNQNARKQRGRSAPRKGGKNNGAGNRSNEPKVRGNPKQLLEKYKNQAREAKQAGDRVQAEYFYQFADHYQRILNEITARNGGNNRTDDAPQDDEQAEQQQDGAKQRRGRGRRQRGAEQADTAVETAEASTANAADPANAEQPVEVHPELDLGASGEEEKPKRRRAPAQRRRSPRVKAEEGAPEGEAAPAAGSNPEGNEAA